MKTRKFMALGLATIMMVAYSATAAAAEPAAAPTTGAGSYEGYVEKEVVGGTYTTEAAASLAFVIDPQMIAAGRLGESVTIESGATVLFERKDADAAKNYTSQSDVITITSKSSVDADATVLATLSTVEGFELVESKGDLTSDEKGAPQLYIAITDGENEFPITSAEGAKYLKKINGADDQFEINYDADSDPKYTYDPKSGATFNTQEVYIVAAAAGKWTEVEVLPSITLVYGIDAHVDVAAPTFTTGSGVGEINYTAGVGDDALDHIVSIKLTNSENGKTYDGFVKNGTTWGDAVVSDSVITLDSKFISFFTANDTVEAAITYVDAAGETQTAKVDVKTN